MGKRLVRIVAAALALAALSSSAYAQKVKYFNFSSAGDNQKYLEQMKASFEAKNPGIAVDVETVAFADYFTQLQTRVAAGDAPDCFELNYENFVSYAKKDLLKDLGPIFKKTGFDTKAVSPKALGAFAIGSKQYGLPSSFSNVVLIYNKELFDKAKVGYPTDKWTWSDEQAAAEKIRALGPDIYGIYQPVQFWEFYKVVRQNGGSLFSADGKKFSLDTPQNVETLQFMVDRLNKSNVMPTAKQLAGMGDWDLFKSGRLGMIVTGIWAFSDFAKDCSFAWDVAVEPGKKAKATHFFSNGIVVAKDSKNAEAAAKWAEFMSASKEAATIRIAAGWELPAVVDPEVTAAYLKITPPANRKAVFDSLNYLVTPPVVEQMQELTDTLGAQLEAARDGKKTPAEALRDAQKECSSKIKL
jgi:ABC-type sugar transport system, periplasmic component